MTAPPNAPLAAADFAEQFPVSRETRARLATLVDTLGHWQKAINLVGPSTLADPWRRHILDSAQLLDLLPPDPAPVLDVGSGAGFPGLVLAILGVPDVHLVESDQRKAAFLREAARRTDAAVTIHARRLESLTPWPARVITCRAFAPLERLLTVVSPFIDRKTMCILPKGARAEEELTRAGKEWKMHVDRFQSRTDDQGVIFRLEDLHRDN